MSSLVLPSGAWHRAMGTYSPDTETLKATGPSLPIEGVNHLLPAGLRRSTAVMCLPEDYPCRGAPGSRGRGGVATEAGDRQEGTQDLGAAHSWHLDVLSGVPVGSSM